MANDGKGRLPGDVPRLQASGLEPKTARDLEAFLKSIALGVVATQGTEGLRIGLGGAIGDLLVFDGEQWQVVPVGAAGEVLTADPTEALGVDWAAPSGSGHALRVPVSFGLTFTDKAQAVVTGETWVTATSSIVGAVVVPAGTDPDELRLLNFQVVISDLVVGDGFTVTVYSEPEAKGSYDVMILGG